MAKYLFPGAVYKKLVHAAFIFNVAYPNLELGLRVPNNLKEIHQLYRLSTRQYLGLGALLQFIPGRQSYKIREQFSELLSQSLKENFDDNPKFQSKFPYFVKRSYKSKESFINLSSVYGFLSEVKYGFSLRAVVYSTRHYPFKEIIAMLFSGLIIYDPQSSRFKRDKHPWYSALYWVLNPFYPLHNLLNFTQFLLFKLIDQGQEDNRRSIPRILLKVIVNLATWLLNIPIMAAKAVFDIVPFLVTNLVVDPIVHLLKSLKEAIFTHDKRLVFATVDEFRELHNQSKKRVTVGEPVSVPKPKKDTYKSTFIGATREEIYKPFSPEHHDNQWVAKRVPAKDSAKIRQSLRTAGMFREIKMDCISPGSNKTSGYSPNDGSNYSV